MRLEGMGGVCAPGDGGGGRGDEELPALPGVGGGGWPSFGGMTTEMGAGDAAAPDPPLNAATRDASSDDTAGAAPPGREDGTGGGGLDDTGFAICAI